LVSFRASVSDAASDGERNNRIISLQLFWQPFWQVQLSWLEQPFSLERLSWQVLPS